MIYLVDLESIETRYTYWWKTHFPKLIQSHNLPLTVISGPDELPQNQVPGAFLNFGATNVYKAAQIDAISRLFCDNKIKDNDYFLFADAWHPGIINLKYMAQLFNINIKIGGMWHAGNYDKYDFLGRLGNQKWINYAEKSFFECYDHNYFATNFHMYMFIDNVLEGDAFEAKEKCIQTGWPMEFLPDILLSSEPIEKKDLILFPHRIAPEKQVEIFKDLAESIPEYKWVICQNQELSKSEYHKLLLQSKIVFSASLQETLGLAMGNDAPIARSIPLSPNRLSYTEIFEDYPDFLYPSAWTESWAGYQENKEQLKAIIRKMINEYDRYVPSIDLYTSKTMPKFYNADNLLEILRECQK